MNIILCTDKVGGMMFNNRRVSRDSTVYDDIMKTVRGEVLYIKPYSEKLFLPLAEKHGMPKTVPDPLRVATDGQWCFIEDEDITPFLDSVEKILIYNWNTRYPYELKFDTDNLIGNFKLTDRRKFEGTSHEEIIRELYRKDYRSK